MKRLLRLERSQETKDFEMVILNWLFIVDLRVDPGSRICRFCKGRPFLHSYSECPGKKLEEVMEEFDRRFSVFEEVPDQVSDPMSV